MRNPGGYATLTSERGVAEIDTFTCAHCNSIKHVKPKERPEDLGGHCRQCDHLICASCVRKGTCTPWERQMEIMEARAAARRSYDECSQ